MPRCFHIETVLGFSSSSRATAPVSPSFSINCECDMSYNSHTVNVTSRPNSRSVYFPGPSPRELMFPARHDALAVMAKTNLPHASTKEEVCKRLVLLRRARGLKQKEIAAQAGMTTTQWANYERLERMPNVQDMIRLADVQGVTLDYIYRGVMSSLPHHLAMKIGDVAESDAKIEGVHDEEADIAGGTGRRHAAGR